MSLKLRTKAILVWVKINELKKCEKVNDDYALQEGEAMFQVELLSPKDEYNILDVAREVDWEKTPAGVEQRVDKGPNWYLWKITKVKKSIHNWKGVLDDDGKTIECNEENKVLLFNCNKEYIDALIDYVTVLEGKERKIKDSEIKNSPDGQSGI